MPSLIISMLLISSFTILAQGTLSAPVLIEELQSITAENADYIEQVAMFGDSRHTWMQVAFSPDGTLLAAGGRMGTSGVFQIYDLTTGLELFNILDNTGMIISLSFSPDSSTLATVSIDGAIKFWDIGIQNQITLIQIPGIDEFKRISDASFSPELDYLALAHGDALRLWNLVTGSEIQRLEYPRDAVVSVDFSPDGNLLSYGTFGGSGIGNSKLHLFNIETTVEETVIKISSIPDLAMTAFSDFSSNSRLLVFNISDESGVGIALLDLETSILQEPVYGGSDFLNDIAFAPSGSIMALANGNNLDDNFLAIWNMETGEQVKKFDNYEKAVIDTSFNLDGSLLASASTDGTVRLWAVQR